MRVKIKGQEKPLDLPTEILLPRGDSSCCWEAPNWLVSEAFDRKKCADLRGLLTAAYFDYNEDGNDWDSQLDEFRDERDTDITTKLLGEKEALQGLLDAFLNSYKFTDARLVAGIRVRIVPPPKKELAEAKKNKVERRYWPRPSFKSQITLCKKS